MFRFFGGIVRLARPEETTETIFPAPRHDVHVEMRHALADAVVDGHEGTVGCKRGLDSTSQELGGGKERLYERGGEIRKGFDVVFRNEQGMARKDGPMVEEGD